MREQKKIKKSKQKNTVSQELTIKVLPASQPTVEDLLPERENSEYMLQKSWVSEKQLLKIVQKTPDQHVYTRKGKGGAMWSYLTQSYVIKVLNYIFGWNWDFEIVDKGREGDQVWVQGKLTVKSSRGEMITKTQFGRADIKYLKGTKQMLDYGNDLKSASSDALKKCASLLGIGADIYGKMEFKQEAGVDIEATKEVVAKVMYKCAGCDVAISEQEAQYSQKMFKKPLCRACQKDYGK